MLWLLDLIHCDFGLNGLLLPLHIYLVLSSLSVSQREGPGIIVSASNAVAEPRGHATMIFKGIRNVD